MNVHFRKNNNHVLITAWVYYSIIVYFCNASEFYVYLSTMCIIFITVSGKIVIIVIENRDYVTDTSLTFKYEKKTSHVMYIPRYRFDTVR